MNNTYRIEYTGDEVLKLLQKIDELTKSMGLEIIVSPDKAEKPGVYAIEVEEMALHAKYRQILLVSNYIDEAGIEYASVFQTLFDAKQGKVKTRKQSYNKEQLKYEWTAWETVGEVDLGNYYTKTEIDSKVSSVYKYKGTVPSPMLLPDNNEIGDVYNTIFAGYVPIHKENNYTLTGISYEGNLTTNTEITLTFANDVTTYFNGTPIDGADIAFWFDNYYFFIGEIISYSNNSYVVKVADLDIKDTEYSLNPCFEGISYYKDEFSRGRITSLTLQSVHYWQNVGSAVAYEYIPKGGNVAYTGTGWDSLGTTVDTSNFATKNELSNKVNVSELNNYYTKTEIDSKVSSVYKYKGTVPSPMLLPFNKEVGDVYNTTFAGYVYSVSDKNFTLTGISSSDGESISMNSEITLTFDKNISEVGSVGFVGTGADIAFWFDSSRFFIGEVISFSSNSIVVKMADLDITNTGYYKNPVLDSVQYIFSQFLSGVITSIAIESIRYFAAVEFDFRYEYIPKGGNVGYDGTAGGNNGWDSLGTTIDTSNLATKNEMNNAIASAITTTLNTEV